jgi:lactate permease
LKVAVEAAIASGHAGNITSFDMFIKSIGQWAALIHLPMIFVMPLFCEYDAHPFFW